MTPIIYLAGLFESRERLKGYRQALQNENIPVTSRWLDEPPGILPIAAAQQDFYDIRQATHLILDTRDDDARGGREVEWGYAMALGKKLWLVGPERNIFHACRDREFNAFGEVLTALKEEART